MRWLGAAWGVLGVAFLLGSAAVRLGLKTLELKGLTLGPSEWAGLALSLVLFGYLKGYLALHKGFSPRVVARAYYLFRHPRWLWTLLAPAFCIGYFAATRKRKIVAWGISLAVFGLVWTVRQLDQPWKGIVDAGVALALAWGMVTILSLSFRTLLGKPPTVAPDVPELASKS